MFYAFTPGEHLRVDRGPYWHHGIYFGDGWIIHLSGLFGGKDSAEVQWCRVEDFVGSSGLHALEIVHYGSCDPSGIVLARAQGQLGRTGYGVLRNNCEHFARWCKTGQLVSEQIEAAKATGVGVGGGAGATAAGVAIVAAGGAVAGTSAPGIMSGLAAVGSTVGGGAAAGVVVLAAAPSAVAGLAVCRAYRDDPALPEADRRARATARATGSVSAVATTLATVGAISAAGLPGLSAAGISSGLAAIGGTMLGGVVVAVAAPAVVSAALAWLAYRLSGR